MRICNSEAMKMIKSLEADLSNIKLNETYNTAISYKEGEEKTKVNYDYELTRSEIATINRKIRNIKHALAVANSTYLIDDFNITIGDALIYLAQLNNEYNIVSQLAGRNKLTRRITANGVLEYTECTYDPEKAKQDQKEIYAKIGKLQVAIDRANLNCFIEI